MLLCLLYLGSGYQNDISFFFIVKFQFFYLQGKLKVVEEVHFAHERTDRTDTGFLFRGLSIMLIIVV